MTDPHFTELLAVLRRGGGQAGYFTLPDSRQHWDIDAPTNTEEKDVYFSVYTYEDKSRKAEKLYAVNALVADFDAKSFGADMESALAAARQYSPSVIICSGGGYHAYWLLDEPFVCEDAGDRDRIRLVLKAWAKFVGADPAAALPTQLLRVPGTLNRKYDPPRSVEIVEWGLERLYTLEELESQAQPLAKIVPPARLRDDRRDLHGSSVIERFNQTHTVGDIVCPHSYVITPDGRYFRRPVKSGRGASGYYRDDRLYSFSSSDPLSNGHQVDAFDAFRILNHGGDIKAAVKAAAQELGMSLQRPEIRRDARASEDLGEKSTATEEARLPVIQLGNQQLRDQTAAAIDALQKSNEPPWLFVRNGRLVDIRRDEVGKPSIRILDEAALRGKLTLVADFIGVRTKGETEELTSGHPPRNVVGDVLARGEWPFPPLVGLIQSPSIRPDGSLITKEGYDCATGLFYAPSEPMRGLDIPESPTPEQVDAALKLVEEAIVDFPFADAPSRANALALLMTPVIRPLIDGLVPLAIIDAPKVGTGKTLLAQAVSTLATGDPSPGVMTPTQDEAEMRKRITSTLLPGANIIVFDNLGLQLKSDELSAALTSNTWKDRRLGASENVELLQRATWIVTGNNVRLGGDIPRRSYWIKLDAKSSRPFQRSGFRHPDLLAWINENRPSLIVAVLTIARAWVNAGRPMRKKRLMGSFQPWTDVIGGILDHVGVDGFLGNTNELLEEVDEESAQWEAFLGKLAEATNGEPQTVDAICRRIANDPELRGLLPDSLAPFWQPVQHGGPVDVTELQKKMPYELRKRKDTRYGDSEARIEVVQRYKGSNKTREWRFTIGGSECPSSPSTSEPLAVVGKGTSMPGCSGLDSGAPFPDRLKVSPPISPSPLDSTGTLSDESDAGEAV